MSRLDIKRTLSSRSDRVKCVDIHPTEPWLMTALYNGQVQLWNYSTQELVKSFEITELPVRAARFVARKQWLVCGADDMQLRVYNYNTLEKVKQLEAHTDYIRCVAAHPTLPLVLSCADDMLIKLWDWERGWQCTQVFEGHAHYVMHVCFNPRDTNTFASASLDRSIKVWGLGAPHAHFTLEGHDKGVNAVDYYLGGDKPYLLSGSDDRTVKVWDYHHKTCVATLEGHSNNVSVVAYHAALNLIVSGSEDGSVRLWHGNTYRLEKTLNYGLERVWGVALLKGSNRLALGFDEGAVMLKLASEAPAVSMDVSGKILAARHTEILALTLKPPAEGAAPPADGERVPQALKELGTSEFYPGQLAHDAQGRFAVVCGDGEYVIYTALAWRNKSFGQAQEFVWGLETGEYATRESSSRVRMFRNFKETRTFRPPFAAEGIFGGALLGVRSTAFVCLYDWAEARLVRRIDVVPHAVYWSENGQLVALACDQAFYILRYCRDRIASKLEAAAAGADGADADGFEEAFEVLCDVPERVRTAHWVGDCFVYVSAANKLNYCVGGEVSTIAHLDRKLYLLGYLPRDNRLYLADKQLNVVSYGLHLGVVNFQTLVLRGDLAAAEQLLASIPAEHHQRLAQFLDARGHKEKALAISPEPEYRLELALQLGKLELALELAARAPSAAKWRQLADLALAAGKLSLAEQCLTHARDLPGLLLLYVAMGARHKLDALAELAGEDQRANVSFACALLQGRPEQCVEVLVQAGRVPEAAFLARTFVPSQVSDLVKLWRDELARTNAKAAEALADPQEFPNLFPDLEPALKVEALLRAHSRRTVLPAAAAPAFPTLLARDLLAEFKQTGKLDLPGAPASAAVPQQPPQTPQQPQPHAQKPSPQTPQAAPVSAPPAATTPATKQPPLAQAALPSTTPKPASPQVPPASAQPASPQVPQQAAPPLPAGGYPGGAPATPAKTAPAPSVPATPSTPAAVPQPAPPAATLTPVVASQPPTSSPGTPARPPPFAVAATPTPAAVATPPPATPTGTPPAGSPAPNPASFFSSLLTGAPSPGAAVLQPSSPAPPAAAKPPAASLIQLDDFDFGAPAPAGGAASTADADRSLEDDLENWEKESFK